MASKVVRQHFETNKTSVSNTTLQTKLWNKRSFEIVEIRFLPCDIDLPLLARRQAGELQVESQ